MLPSTKRNLAFGVFLCVVTLVVLYSYCNGNSVCYTFPFFSGMERERLEKPEVLVTFDITIPRKHKAKPEDNTRQKTGHSTAADHQKNVYITGENEEKLHFAVFNTTSREEKLLSKEDFKDIKTRENNTLESKEHLLPPSDIVGEAADEILRKANISEDEANRELVRVEKVDESIDREYNKNEFLQKVIASRGSGTKSPGKRLVRVERVDLTSEEEEEMREPVKQVHEPVKGRLLRVQSGMDSKIENLELKHARRFGMTYATREVQNYTSYKKWSKIKNKLSSEENEKRETSKSTLPPFFAKFLNVTAKERQLIDFLHNYTDKPKPLNSTNTALHDDQANASNEAVKGKEIHGSNLSVAYTKKGHHLHNPSTAKLENTEKLHAREKRSKAEHTLLDALVAKLLNTTVERNYTTGFPGKSKIVMKPFNLSGALKSAIERSHDLADIDINDPKSESTALLVKFLKENGRYEIQLPSNVSKSRGNKDMTVSKFENSSSELAISSEKTIDLKKALLELANRIDFNRKDNNTQRTLDKQNGAGDLTMLWLLLRQSSFQDLGTFNLSRVLKDIAGKPLEDRLTTRRAITDKGDGELNNDSVESGQRPDVTIYRPKLDKQKNDTMKPVRKNKSETEISLRGYRTLYTVRDYLNETSIGNLKNITSFSSGSGAWESGEEETNGRVGACVECDHGKIHRRAEQQTTNPPSQGKSERRMRTKQATNGILKFDNISCEELDPKVLLYNRIFKTGSSTTEFIIMNSSSAMNFDYKIGTTEDWYDKGKSGPYPGLIIRKVNKKLIKHPRMAFVAHFYFRSRLNLSQAHTYINQVRQPVRRLVSHYHYMRSRNRPKNRLKEFLASKEKKESLEKCLRQQHKGCRSNVMTRFFCGRHYYCRKGTLRALLKAKRNVKRFYAAVGLLENYDVYLQILNKRLPKFFPKIFTGDIGRFKYNPDYNFHDVPKDLIAEIQRANWADKSLYSFIKRRFWKQAQACGLHSRAL